MHTSPKLSALIAVALILAMALSLIPIGLAPVLAVSPNIVISQVYGGGGNTGGMSDRLDAKAPAAHPRAVAAQRPVDGSVRPGAKAGAAAGAVLARSV